MILPASGFTAGTYGYCTYPSCLYKTSDNSEAALLALRLLYEQGHGELPQTVANRWQRTDVWPARAIT